VSGGKKVSAAMKFSHPREITNPYCSVQKSNDIKPPPGYTWCLASERKTGSGRSAFGAI
jgi:hypothetical protein